MKNHHNRITAIAVLLSGFAPSIALGATQLTIHPVYNRNTLLALGINLFSCVLPLIFTSIAGFLFHRRGIRGWKLVLAVAGFLLLSWVICGFVLGVIGAIMLPPIEP